MQCAKQQLFCSGHRMSTYVSRKKYKIKDAIYPNYQSSDLGLEMTVQSCDHILIWASAGNGKLMELLAANQITHVLESSSNVLSCKNI